MKCTARNQIFNQGSLDQYGCPNCGCSCAPFSHAGCQTQCNEEGKVFVDGAKDIHGCDMCQCGCMNRNCSAECQGRQYETKIGPGGCITRCHCICPTLDCDAPCGPGLGKKGPEDLAGCVTYCGGCLTPGR